MNIFERVLENSLAYVKLHNEMNKALQSALNNERFSVNIVPIYEDLLASNKVLTEGLLDNFRAKLKSLIKRTPTPEDIKKYYAKLSPENQTALKSEIANGDKQARLTKELAMMTLKVKEIFKKEIKDISNKLYNAEDANTVKGRNARQVIAALYSKLVPGIERWQPALYDKAKDKVAFDPKSTGLGETPKIQGGPGGGGLF